MTKYVCKIILWILGFYCSPSVELPKENVMYLANHSSWLDYFIVKAYLNPQILQYYPSSNSYSSMNFLQFLYLSCCPSLSSKPAKSLLDCTKGSGRSFLIFPECTSSNGQGVLTFMVKKSLHSMKYTFVHIRFSFFYSRFSDKNLCFPSGNLFKSFIYCASKKTSRFDLQLSNSSVSQNLDADFAKSFGLEKLSLSVIDKINFLKEYVK